VAWGWGRALILSAGTAFLAGPGTGAERSGLRGRKDALSIRLFSTIRWNAPAGRFQAHRDASAWLEALGDRDHDCAIDRRARTRSDRQRVSIGWRGTWRMRFQRQLADDPLATSCEAGLRRALAETFIRKSCKSNCLFYLMAGVAIATLAPKTQLLEPSQCYPSLGRCARCHDP